MRFISLDSDSEATPEAESDHGCHYGQSHSSDSSYRSPSESDSVQSSRHHSSHSTESPNNSDSDNDMEAQRRHLKNQLRTAKAREAALFNKAKRRLAQQAVLKPPEHPADEFRDLIKADSALNQPIQANQGRTQRFQRLRLLVSYLKAWGKKVAAACLMAGSEADASNESKNTTVNHSLTTSIIDDTNMRLASTVSGANELRKSRVVSVMNHVQTVIFNSSQEGGKVQHKIFKAHTPLVCLPKADTNSIATEFVTRLFSFVGKVSARFRSFGIPEDLMKGIKCQATTCCFDSLKTNLAVLKKIRTAISHQHVAHGHDCIYPFLAVKCNIHALALQRRPLLEGYVGFWSSLVRLGHLFEVHSFRSQFRSALLAVVVESFSYIVVPELESGAAKEWKERRQEILGMDLNLDHDSRHPKKRFEYHKKLAKWDNSDADSHKITHRCDGGCCLGDTHEAKARFALLQVCKIYTILFGFGYPVPLLYRWIHAARSLQYCKAAKQHVMAVFCLTCPSPCCVCQQSLDRV